MDEEQDVIEADEAREILDAVVTPYLDEDWYLLDCDDYTARLNKGDRNLIIRVGWTGQVEIEETGLTASQTNGRLVAWVLLIAALLVTYALVSAVGLI
jgi:hypothetical protein